MKNLVTLFLSLTLASGCATAGSFTVKKDTEGNLIPVYEGTAEGAAAVGISWVESQNETNEVRPVSQSFECQPHAVECWRQRGETMRMEMVYNNANGGKPEKRSTAETYMLMEHEESMWWKSFWGSLANTGLNGLVSWAINDRNADVQETYNKELFRTLRAGYENGGTQSYAFQTEGGAVDFAQVGRDGNVAGNDLGQGAVNGDLIGNDDLSNQGDGQGGNFAPNQPLQGDVGDGSSVTQPSFTSNPVNADSEASLFARENPAS